MANLRIFIFLSCSFLMLLAPVSSFAQQTNSGPRKSVSPKQPLSLIEDTEDLATIDPITYDVAPDAPLSSTDERSKPNHRRVQITDSIKAENTVSEPARNQYLELTSIDPLKKRD